MKRWIGVLLVLLLLTGCSPKEQEPTSTAEDSLSATQSEINTQQPTQSETAPALQEFALKSDACTGMATMGEDLLLFEQDALTILDGQTLEKEVSVQIPGIPGPDSGLVRVKADGVAYFDAADKSIVFLGVNLSQTVRLQLPEDMIGTACLSPDWSRIYYCTDSAVRVLDMGTGASHLVKEQTAHWQSVTGVLLDGAVLRCTQKRADGTERTALISAKTGELLYEGENLAALISGNDRYFLSVEQGLVKELVFGTPDAPAQALWPAYLPEFVGVLPGASGVVTVHNDQGMRYAELYDLTTGWRTASVCLGASAEVCGFTAEDGGRIIWLHCGDVLYRWETAESATGDTAVYTARRYTRQEPDEVGLAAVETAAQQLEQRYGVELLLGSEAERIVPWDYSFETEYLTQVYDRAFAVLQRTMDQFPERFFTQAAERSENGKLTIVLVRGIYGALEKGTLASAGGIQYWQDGNMYIALSMGAELERYFYHEMGHVIDTRVLSTSTAFYEWEKLNPPDFRYDNDYIANQNRQDLQYLQDADRSFIDTYSMSFALEDRSRILEYASLPGNEKYFTSPIMQQKLQRICNGIRQAFGLEGDARRFIWEQYLA